MLLRQLLTQNKPVTTIRSSFDQNWSMLSPRLEQSVTEIGALASDACLVVRPCSHSESPSAASLLQVAFLPPSSLAGFDWPMNDSPSANQAIWTALASFSSASLRNCLWACAWSCPFSSHGTAATEGEPWTLRTPWMRSVVHRPSWALCADLEHDQWSGEESLFKFELIASRWILTSPQGSHNCEAPFSAQLCRHIEVPREVLAQLRVSFLDVLYQLPHGEFLIPWARHFDNLTRRYGLTYTGEDIVQEF